MASGFLDQFDSCVLPVHAGSDRGAAGHDPTHHQIAATASLWPLSAAGMIPGCRYAAMGSCGMLVLFQNENIFSLVHTFKIKITGLLMFK